MIDDITTMARALHDQFDTRRLVDRLVTVRLRTTFSATWTCAARKLDERPRI